MRFMTIRHLSLRSSRSAPILKALLLTALCCASLLGATAWAWQEESAEQQQPALPTAENPTEGHQTEGPWLSDVRPASFKDITPGLSTLADVTATLGEPAEKTDLDGSSILRFDIKPFSAVEIVTSQGKVISVVMRFGEPADLEAITKGLGLSNFRPAPIPDENGQLLGQVYPERGILFGFAENDPALRVEHVVLEPITAEPFILRAQYDAERRYSENLADLDYATTLDENDARIYWQMAEILSVTGQISQALANAQKAVELDPDNAQYRLTLARSLAAIGKQDEAVEMTQEIVTSDSTPTELKARGFCQLGDLLAEGPQHDYKTAITHHLTAINMALPLATDQRPEVRRLAKRVLIDAHLAAALDVASGRWQRKSEVVPKWLAKADALVDEIIRNDGGDASLKFLTQRKTLEALTKLKGQLDPTATVEALINNGRDLIASAHDPLYKQQLEWRLGQSLLDAALIDRARGQHESSLRYANNALALLKQSGGDRETPSGRNGLLGQTYFFIGSHYATQADDHMGAIAWYEKAAPHYARPLPENASFEIGLRGEQFVSMGVSYWETKNYERGMQLTQQGVQFIQQSVAAGALKPRSLAIPYGNLANMLKQTGNEEEAVRLAKRASELEEAANGSQQR